MRSEHYWSSYRRVLLAAGGLKHIDVKLSAVTDGLMASLVDLGRYPIDALDQRRGRDMMARLRDDLRREGLCRLDGFLQPAAVQRLVEQAQAAETHAYYGLTEASPYFNEFESQLPIDHPRNIRTKRQLGLVAADLIPPDCDLHSLYQSQALTRFLAEVLDKPILYRVADPYQKTTMTVMPEGAGHNWHFDEADFTVTLMLRKPEQGGDFECVPMLRSATDENYDGVRNVLRGQRECVRVIPFEPGTLMVFRGRHALHRVAPVSGSRSRLIALFSYSTVPNWIGTKHTNAQVFGPRVEI
jgi:hypothetical protein